MSTAALASSRSPPTPTPLLKAVILVGGAQKGTRFRPLSLQLPKPLFEVAGMPLIEHHISQLCKLDHLAEICLLGFYPVEQFTDFIASCARKYAHVQVRYLQEQCALGTAGGLLLHKKELFQDPTPSAVFVLNADVCGDLPLCEMVRELERQQPVAECVILTTEATREQSVNYGSVVVDSSDSENPSGYVLHYVEKPTTFISTHISCGVYLLRGESLESLLELAAKLALERSNNNGSPTLHQYHGQIMFEKDLFPQLTAWRTLFALHTSRWWSQTKTAGAVLYANRHYLRLYRKQNPQLLADHQLCEIVGDVYIDPSAQVHPTAKIGPNVSIGANAQIKAGVRVRESIVLQECVLDENCCVLHSVIGWRSYIGPWARIEGSPISPNPNIPFAKLDNKPLFNANGRLNPSLTILGSDVRVTKETVILNSVVLPYKELSASYNNQIIL